MCIMQFFYDSHKGLLTNRCDAGYGALKCYKDRKYEYVCPLAILKNLKKKLFNS